MFYSEDTEPFIPIDIIQHSVSRGEEGRVKRSATPLHIRIHCLVAEIG